MMKKSTPAITTMTKKQGTKAAAPAAKKALPAQKPAASARKMAAPANKATATAKKVVKRAPVKNEKKIEKPAEPVGKIPVEEEKTESWPETYVAPPMPERLPKLEFQQWEKPAGSEEVQGKEGERGQMPSFKTTELRELDMEMTWARENNKYMYIADMHGQAATFFTYNAQVFEFHAEVKKAIVHKTQSKEDAAEAFRKELVSAMKYGRPLVVHIKTMVPRFSDYDMKGVLPLENHFFHRQNTFDNAKQWLRPHEDKDIFGNEGNFHVNENFNLIILSNMTDPDCDDEII